MHMSSSAPSSHVSDQVSYYEQVRDKPYPMSVCIAALVAVSLCCWGGIIYVVSLI